MCNRCIALGFTIGDLRSQLEGHDGEAVRRQPPPPGLALPLRELNPEDWGSLILSRNGLSSTIAQWFCKKKKKTKKKVFWVIFWVVFWVIPFFEQLFWVAFLSKPTFLSTLLSEFIFLSTFLSDFYFFEWFLTFLSTFLRKILLFWVPFRVFYLFLYFF